MQFIKAILIFWCFCSVATAEIHKTADLQLIKSTILNSPKDTLVLFDIDDTLIMPTDQIYIKDATHEARPFIKSIYKDFEQRYGKQGYDELRSLILATCKYRTVTPDTLALLHELAQKGYRTLGITLTGTGKYGIIQSMETWRVDTLKTVGINFHPSFPDVAAGQLDQFITTKERYDTKQVCSPSAVNGVLFGCYAPKGEVLDGYLQVTNNMPKKIIFVDDKLYNIKSVEEFCKRNNIEFVGFEYTAIFDEAKKVTMDLRLAKLQFAILEHTRVWLGDAEATKVLAKLDQAS